MRMQSFALSGPFNYVLLCGCLAPKKYPGVRITLVKFHFGRKFIEKDATCFLGINIFLLTLAAS